MIEDALGGPILNLTTWYVRAADAPLFPVATGFQYRTINYRVRRVIELEAGGSPSGTGPSILCVGLVCDREAH